MTPIQHHRLPFRVARAGFLGIAALLFALPACSDATTPVTGSGPCEVNASPGGEGPRILFIGNSLTYYNDMPLILASLFEKASLPFGQIAQLSRPNYGLVDHWSGDDVHDVLKEGWDVVILQQGPSATEGRPSLLEYSARFAKEIRAAGAVPAMYMVWPSRSRFFDFDGVSDSYATAAEQIDGLLFPVGEAWRSAWEREPGLGLYGYDGFHPSGLGSYLAALVIFEQLTSVDLSLVGSRFCTPSGETILSAKEMQILRDAVLEANSKFGRSVGDGVVPER